MNCKRNKYHFTIFHLKPVLLLSFAILSFGFCYSQGEKLVIITNTEGAPAEMTLKDVKRVFKGEEQRWDGGKKISVAFMKTNAPLGELAAKKLLNMSGNEYNKLWLALVFQGKAKAPSFFNSETDLLNYVSSTPGAIGILSEKSASNSAKVRIDGKEFF